MSDRSRYRYTTPVDMPRGSHYGSNYHILPSRKLGRNVCAYSNLEYENLLSLEMNPEIEFFCEQPAKVFVIADGKKQETIFDAYVFYRNGVEQMQEVKYYDELHSNTEKGERDQEQIRNQKIWCETNQIDHIVRTEHEIEREAFTARNLAWLAAKARRWHNSDREMEKYICHYLEKHHSATIGLMYEAGMFNRYNGLDVLADMVYRGKIFIKDIDAEVISNASEVTLYGK